jgi:hypothetical protein
MQEGTLKDLPHWEQKGLGPSFTLHRHGLYRMSKHASLSMEFIWSDPTYLPSFFKLITNELFTNEIERGVSKFLEILSSLSKGVESKSKVLRNKTKASS